MIRQGDVLLIEVNSIPENAKAARRDKGRLVLAYGEITGHAHVVDAPPEEATLLTDADNRRFLRLMANATLVHEEHAAVLLPAGNYQQIRQQEWDESKELPAERVRNVWD